MSIVFKNEDEKTRSEYLKDVCVTLACDDKQIDAHKIIFGNNEACESVDTIDNSEIIVKNIREVKNDTVYI